MWRARVSHNRHEYVKYFHTAEAAAAAAIKMRNDLYTHNEEDRKAS
jgi:hypothetical protein